MLNQIFKRFLRLYFGEYNSRLQTLIDARSDACYKVALNYLNSPSCAKQKIIFQANQNYYETALACTSCPLYRDYEGHKLNLLVQELNKLT